MPINLSMMLIFIVHNSFDIHK